jgi:hypothetical protein
MGECELPTIKFKHINRSFCDTNGPWPAMVSLEEEEKKHREGAFKELAVVSAV